jgi:hypothetical protein
LPGGESPPRRRIDQRQKAPAAAAHRRASPGPGGVPVSTRVSKIANVIIPAAGQDRAPLLCTEAYGLQ